MPENKTPQYERQYKISGRVPPYSEQAEMAVLGSIFLNNKAIPVVCRHIEFEDFYIEANRRIFKAVMDLRSKGIPIDAVTVGKRLIDTGELDKVGGIKAFDGLTDSVATIQNVEYYAKQVKEMSARRKMIYCAQEIVATGFDAVESTDDFLSESRKKITIASNTLITATGPRQIAPVVKEIYNELVQAKLPEGVINTGIGPIDITQGGVWPGELTTVAGRPGMGKSAFATNLYTNTAILQGKKVLVFSLEETLKQIVTRMLARFSDVNITDLRLRKVREKEHWSRIIEACELLTKENQLWVEEATGLSSSQMAQMIAYHKDTHGIDLVVADHLSEIREVGENETAKMSAAARGARDICKELELPFVLLAQLNRELERRPNKRPMLSDLRQSGEIEQISRTVWFLYREGYYIPDGESRMDMELIVAKANNGTTGTLRLYADMSRMFITGWDVREHGLWPSDNSTDVDARNKSRERTRTTGQTNIFETGRDTNNDDY